jgi:PAS domain S-box-containing protein
MRPFPRFLPLLAALLTSALVLAGVFELDRLERERLTQRNRVETLDRLSIVRSRIESAINARLFLNRGLMAYVSTHPRITVPEFQVFADALIRQQKGIRSIQLAKDSIVSHIYPMEGNRAALGLKLLQQPKQRDAVARAIESRNTVVAGPVELVQGGTAFISRTPIFLTRSGAAPGSGAYWGLATVILDKDTLFTEAGLTHKSAKFDFALRGTDGTGPDGAVFWGNPMMFETGSVRLDISLPNGSWQLAALPRNGRGTPGSPWLVEGGILLALLAGTLAWFLARNPAALRLRVLQATRDLKESEAHFRSLLENASDFVMFRLVVQPGTPVGAEVLLISPSVHDIMGLPNPYSLASWFDCFDPDDIGWITARKDWSLAHGANFSAQMRWFHPERQAWVWLSMLVTPATDAEGSTTHFNGIIQDITAQKQAEELLQRAYDALENQVAERTAELRETNEQLKIEISEREYAKKTLRAQHDLYYALIKAQSDIGESVVIIENRRLIFANDASCLQFGYTLEELKALPSFIHLVHPDDRERILENHRRRLAGEPSQNRYETGIITRDGQRREAEIAVATIHNDSTPRIVVVMQDITKRKRMADALHSQLLFTQALVEAIPSPVFYKNKEGEYLGCNQAFETAFGLSRQDIGGKTVYDVMPRELADIYYAMDQALFQEPGRQVYESQVGLADGTRREVIFNKATFTDASGELSGLVGVILDITERKQMEEYLRRAHDELETRVRERTRELARINDELNVEIAYRKQAEEGLRESQARLLKAQRIAQLGNWNWDIVSGCLHWSDEIYRVFGLTPQQFDATYEAFLESVHPDDRTHVVESVNATLRAGKSYSIDHRIVLPDGSIRYVHEQAEVELDDGGQPVSMQGTVQDITERKQIEMALRESEERFRILVQQAADAFFLASPQGKLVDVNWQACDCLGYSREELLTMSVQDIEVGHTPEQIAEIWKNMVPGTPIFFEGRHLRKDGATFPVEVAGGIIEIDRQPYIFGLARNITERKRAEKILQRQAQIIDQIHDSVIATDIDGTITFWNDGARQIFGYSAEEATGKHISLLYPRPKSPSINQPVIDHLLTKEVYEAEVQRRKKSGEVFHIHLILSLLKDRDSKIIGLVGYSMDIDERKRLEQQIIEVSENEQKRIGQELHDGLGQHLTGIAFLSKVLEQKLAIQSLPEAVDAAEIVRFVNQGISQTRALARNLFPVELEDNGLMSALEQLAANINKLFGISCTFTCENPVLTHDRIAAINLYRIAQEAANNAAKHSKADNIRITLAAADGKIHLSVTDDGIGFDPALRANHEGMGCHIMQYRAGMLGASLHFQKAAGSGTEVRVAMDW